MTLATTPFPVPVSPVSSTVVLVGATARTLLKTSFITGQLVRISSSESACQKESRRYSSSNWTLTDSWMLSLT